MQTMTANAIEQLAASVASPAQLAALAKMSKMGWKVTKVTGTVNQAEISLGVKGQGVWLRPDGSVVRPAAGNKCAVLPRR